MNWSLQKLKSKCQSQCNKKLTPDYPTVVQLSESRCLFPPSEVGRVKGPLSLPKQCSGGGAPADGRREQSHVQGLDCQQPSCCVAICGPSPISAWKIPGWQLSISQASSTPHGIPHLEEPSLGTGVETSMHSHFCYYLQKPPREHYLPNATIKIK